MAEVSPQGEILDEVLRPGVHGLHKPPKNPDLLALCYRGELYFLPFPQRWGAFSKEQWKDAKRKARALEQNMDQKIPPALSIIARFLLQHYHIAYALGSNSRPHTEDGFVCLVQNLSQKKTHKCHGLDKLRTLVYRLLPMMAVAPQ